MKTRVLLLRPAAPSTGHLGNSHPWLKVAPPDDRYEQEADRKAREAVAAPVAPEPLRPFPPPARPPGFALPPVSRDLPAKAGGSHPLPEKVRAALQPRFTADLSQVRIHEGERADQMARTLDARAFTVGHDVFFRRGACDPNTRLGRELIAHELAHVQQQQHMPHGTGAIAQRKVVTKRYGDKTFEADWKLAGKALDQYFQDLGEKVLQTPGLMSMEAQYVKIYGLEEDQLNDWEVGFIQNVEGSKHDLFWKGIGRTSQGRSILVDGWHKDTEREDGWYDARRATHGEDEEVEQSSEGSGSSSESEASSVPIAIARHVSSSDTPQSRIWWDLAEEGEEPLQLVKSEGQTKFYVWLAAKSKDVKTIYLISEARWTLDWDARADFENRTLTQGEEGGIEVTQEPAIGFSQKPKLRGSSAKQGSRTVEFEWEPEKERRTSSKRRQPEETENPTHKGKDKGKGKKKKKKKLDEP
ncbi:MAG TPA: DUF4157 domain-containing protein [Thermoanaerobaculia bacterium]|nr:DUF4157 domain-containing protein [Thermoanaerobaculia bacterium]